VLGAWTADEKWDFHRRADRSIWAVWSNCASLGVIGKSDFAKRLSRKKIPINLDVRWVIAKPYWIVTMTKTPAGQFKKSRIEWVSRTTLLDTNDFKTRLICTGTPKICTTQIPVAHEFGYTVGNTVVLGRGTSIGLQAHIGATEGHPSFRRSAAEFLLPNDPGRDEQDDPGY